MLTSFLYMTNEEYFTLLWIVLLRGKRAGRFQRTNPCLFQKWRNYCRFIEMILGGKVLEFFALLKVPNQNWPVFPRLVGKLGIFFEFFFNKLLNLLFVFLAKFEWNFNQQQQCDKVSCTLDVAFCKKLALQTWAAHLRIS